MSKNGDSEQKYQSLSKKQANLLRVPSSPQRRSLKDRQAIKQESMLSIMDIGKKMTTDGKSSITSAISAGS